MDFRIECTPEFINPKLTILDPVMLMGSCFTEHMNDKLNRFKFKTIQNPHGVLFNPHSISDALLSYMDQTLVNSNSLFFLNGLWNHWSFHSSRSKTEINDSVTFMNKNIVEGHNFLKNAQWLVITFGSAFVYQINESDIVANCHKAPALFFKKRMLTIDEIVSSYTALIKKIKKFNPGIKLIFTVSPVRHLREGFIENNRSKSALILSIEKIISLFTDCFYFPSYELIIDDLRDYRFYAEDMVHPNYLATKYVWDKFSASCIEGKTREIFKEIEQINNAIQHRPMHPESAAHKKFRHKMSTMISSLSARFPEIDFRPEQEFFKD